MEKKDSFWSSKNWQSYAAIVYLLICLFDFMVMPTIMFIDSPHIPELISSVQSLPAQSQMLILEQTLDDWEPLTMTNGGLFHITFGAILGTVVWSRGKEKITELMNQGKKD